MLARVSTGLLFLSATLVAAAAILPRRHEPPFLIETSRTPAASSHLPIIARLPHYDGEAVLRSNGQHMSSSDFTLVWVTKEVVADELAFEETQLDFEAILQSHFGASDNSLHRGEYREKSPVPRLVRVIEDTSALLQVPNTLLPALDLYLPRFVRPQIIHDAIAATDKRDFTFPEPRLDCFVSKLARSSHLESHELNITAQIVSGEDQSSLKSEERWSTRHSATYGNRKAGEWIVKQMRSFLSTIPEARCELEPYADNFGPNVVCILPAQRGKDARQPFEKRADETYDEEEAVLLSAHYDSRGTFGDPVAPGGNDDGSGTTMLLAVSRILAEAIAKDAGSSYRRRELQLVFFSGEEQGLVGSKHYATSLSEGKASPPGSDHYRSTKLRLALQTDMIAYHSPDEPLQIAFPDKLSTTSATAYLWSLAQLYSPELVPGYTPACCSDHQSKFSCLADHLARYSLR